MENLILSIINVLHKIIFINRPFIFSFNLRILLEKLGQCAIKYTYSQ